MDTFGNKFRVTLFGESHGERIGAVIDGVRPGMKLSPDDFEADIARRRSGARGTTARKESDIPVIVSGIYGGMTTGAPLTIMFSNSDVDDAAYSLFSSVPRPGHADYTARVKYEFNDPRGGGQFSGRMTLPVVAAGVVARRMLPGIEIHADIVSLGGGTDRDEWDDMLDRAAAEGDSLGAVVKCVAENVPAGLGEPFWDSVESLISHAVFSIPGVRGIEFGDGFKAADMKGSEHNDAFGEGGIPVKNGCGGINGGITNGSSVVFRVAFKPTSSIRKPQRTFNFGTGEMTQLSAGGRHDVCFALRTPPVVEAVAAIVLANLTESIA